MASQDPGNHADGAGGDDRDRTSGSPADSSASTRREFLRNGGIATAGLVVGGAIGAAAGASIGHTIGYQDGSVDFGALPVRDEPGFDHVVVLMGENRSFDNLLGWLYTPEDLPEGETFDGLAFGDYANVAPNGERVAAHVYDGKTEEIMGRPNPDPGEEFPHVNTQLFGVVDPPSNATSQVGDMREPFNAPPSGSEPKLDGFIHDYWNNIKRLRAGAEPTMEEARHIMGSFSPDHLPVLSTLAREFAVFDAWFAAVPSQTYCNRSFFHASTSHGYVTNKHGGGYDKWLDAHETPTIFNRLEEAGVSWKIYFDELQLVSLTGVMHAPVLEKYWRTESVRPHVRVLSGCAERRAARVRLHRAAHGLQPQRLPSPVRRLPRDRDRGRDDPRLRDLRRPRGREARGRRVRRDPRERGARRLECHEHPAAHHLR